MRKKKEKTKEKRETTKRVTVTTKANRFFLSASTLLPLQLKLNSKNSDDADRLAFAVHAFMLSLGYKLTAAGEAADGDGTGLPFFSFRFFFSFCG